MIADAGVSFVIPVHNGRRTLPRVLERINAQRDGRPFEIVTVEDRSRDRSAKYLQALHARGDIVYLEGPGRGAAAAINVGIRAATHPIVCQIDQDVLLEDGWLAHVLAALRDPSVAAAQGHYVVSRGAGFWARAAGRDLEWRYARLHDGPVDHVCTGNTAYRASALHSVGLLDESLGYGYDNDLSYRLTAAGHQLVFCKAARAVHLWRDTCAGYMQQQFGQGYGRLDVVARHRSRYRGDAVSNALMMAHAPLMLAAITAFLAAPPLALAGLPWRFTLVGAVAIVMALTIERSAAAASIYRRTRDRASAAFVGAHLLRDVCWSWAILVWAMRRVLRDTSVPAHSMRVRGRLTVAARDPVDAAESRVLAVIPAHNEAESLPRVIRELRGRLPSLDILVVNDGSTDDTDAVLPSLGVKWLTLPQRIGVGGAVRAGLRYAHKHGYTIAIRLDGDGQHRPADIAHLVTPIARDTADAVIGSRYIHRRRRWTMLSASQAVLARFLSVVTGRRVTDPTCGFSAFGPRALALLGRHHPQGYAEPELLLFLARHGLRVEEVPVRIRPRLAGRTSLTPARATLALARTVLALLIVPMRDMVSADE